VALFGAFPEPHTLAQFARRAGISEGRARALHADGKLPRPDQVDADGRPLWLATSIDAWCKQTGRALSEGVAWLHRASPATEPAPVLFQGTVEHKDRFSTVAVYAIVWDTPDGHLVYLTPVYDEQGNGGAHPDDIVEAAMGLVQPAFWAQTLIVQPITGGIGSDIIIPTVHLNLYRLAPEKQEFAEEEAAGLFRRRRVGAVRRSSQVGTTFSGMVEAGEVAAVIGSPVPLWIDGTCTAAAVKRAQAYNSTFTVPDTVTDWPAARDQVLAAISAGMPERFPAGFAALAADARATHERVLSLHARQRDEADGWYLVARPASPEMPFNAEVAITTAKPSSDLDMIALELTQLRDLEAKLSVDAPEGNAYETAIELLMWELLKQRPSAAAGRFEIYGDTYGGPVIEQWRQTLEQAPETVYSTRRLRRLLNGWRRDGILEVLRGPGDMHVVVLKNEHDHLYFHAEWPYDLMHGWNERTIIAADRDSSGAVFALTPMSSGHMKVDPLPLEPGTGPSFGYGYSGGSPYTLYQALIRSALGTPTAPFTLNQVEERNSKLWRAIVRTQGPLRLPWSDVMSWARADAASAGYTGLG
jgi:hypothetical protein